MPLPPVPSIPVSVPGIGRTDGATLAENAEDVRNDLRRAERAYGYGQEIWREATTLPLGEPEAAYRRLNDAHKDMQKRTDALVDAIDKWRRTNAVLMERDDPAARDEAVPALQDLERSAERILTLQDRAFRRLETNRTAQGLVMMDENTVELEARYDRFATAAAQARAALGTE